MLLSRISLPSSEYSLKCPNLKTFKHLYTFKHLSSIPQSFTPALPMYKQNGIFK